MKIKAYFKKDDADKTLEFCIDFIKKNKDYILIVPSLSEELRYLHFKRKRNNRFLVSKAGYSNRIVNIFESELKNISGYKNAIFFGSHMIDIEEDAANSILSKFDNLILFYLDGHNNCPSSITSIKTDQKRFLCKYNYKEEDYEIYICTEDNQGINSVVDSIKNTLKPCN